MITSIMTLEGLKNFYTERKDNPEYTKDILRSLVLDRADKLNFSEENIGIIEAHIGA
ncbi:hypothetical protein ACFLY2_03200 [Patescibacteria group bacterium]